MNLHELKHDIITPLLIAKGFKANSRGYRREVGGFEQRIEIDKGQRSVQNKFCISLFAHPKIQDYPGLPKFPLRTGDAWFTRRLAPTGLDDKWWWIDTLYPSDIDQITQLLSDDVDEWFSDLSSLEDFSGLWFKHVFELEFAAKRLGLTPARLAYAHAVVHAHLGDTEIALKIAEAALKNVGDRAVLFKAKLQEFQKLLVDTKSTDAD